MLIKKLKDTPDGFLSDYLSFREPTFCEICNSLDRPISAEFVERFSVCFDEIR